MSKDLFHQQRETEITARMSEYTFLQIPQHLRDEIKMKRIDQPNFREVYEADKEWQEKHKAFIEALKAQKQREDEIRANFKTEK